METYGEDPFLTASIGVQFVRGIQGNDPKYLKAVATPKHYAVHSGPEPDRHTFDAVVDDRDLIQTYLPQFEACVKEANALSAMCAYNRFRGEACCASELLLNQILREDWGFQGYVVSDSGGVSAGSYPISTGIPESSLETRAVVYGRVQIGTQEPCSDR